MARIRVQRADSMKRVSVEHLREDAARAAQEVMWDAWDAPDKKKRVALAKKALELSPYCADAYTMLALETAATPTKKIELFRKAVEAGEASLGKQAFRELTGAFWGFVETRPYMRARHYLGLALWESGQRAEAVAEYRAMLELNPNDNQGIRYLLIDCLLTLGLDADADALLKRYKDDGGVGWPWSRALLAFRLKGDGAAARKALKIALTNNSYVPPYLLGLRKMPSRLPDYVAVGGEDEAISYLFTGMAAWLAAPGALAWLAEQCADGASARKSGKRVRKNAA